MPKNHFKIANPFLEAGMPIYIDKPFALTVFDAKELIISQWGTIKVDFNTLETETLPRGLLEGSTTKSS